MDKASSKESLVSGLYQDTSVASALLPEPKKPQAFWVFTWMIPDRGISKATAAKAELENLDKFMRQRTRSKDKRSYLEFVVASQDEIRTSLQNVSQCPLGDQEALQSALENRIDIFNAALVVVEFFLPLSFSVTIVRKFWGGLKMLPDVSFCPRLRSKVYSGSSNRFSFQL